MRPLEIPPAARRVLKPLAAQAEWEGVALYVVGGCVRDWTLGQPWGSDIDLVVEGDPSPLARHCADRLGAAVEAFGRFGTLRVMSKKLRVDFARSRSEEYPQPAALPVVVPARIELDLIRRDFTVNAMAVRLTSKGPGELIDPYGGRRDLEAGVLRVLHPQSFRDDPTRVFRAARFLCRFGFKPAPGLLDLAAAALSAGHAARLSRHRVSQELASVLGEKSPACAFERLREWGYLDLVFPDLRWPERAGATVEERLGALALAFGPRAEEFLRSLPIDHALGVRLHEAARLAGAKAAPRVEPSPLAARVLARALPELPKAALKPLLVGGEDLSALGLPQGKEYRAILDDAARAQWGGEFASRRSALAWLKRRLASQKT